ncbi:MAG: ABC transporter permease [Acetobacteraceae bacterium]
MSDLTNIAPILRPAEAGAVFTLAADRGWGHRFQLAAADLREGGRLWRLAWELGFADIRLRYRGSVLGPFWLTISTAIMVGAMAFLYAVLFHTDIHTYLPYLTVSMIFWTYLATMVTEGCACFMGTDSLIKSTRIPFSVHAARSIIRNTIVFGHNLIVIIALYVIMWKSVSFYALWAVPAFFLWVIDGFAISLLFGALCARFRDVPQIIAALMQIAFFITPIMFYANAFKGHPRVNMLMGLNPFLCILEIIRSPILGDPLSLHMVEKALIVSAVVIGVSLIGFARARGRIAYWV